MFKLLFLTPDFNYQTILLTYPSSARNLLDTTKLLNTFIFLANAVHTACHIRSCYVIRTANVKYKSGADLRNKNVA